MPLDLQTRSARAAKMRNKRTRRDLPLLDAQNAIPADWLTTPEAQQDRLERQTIFNEEYFARIRDMDEFFRQKGERCRELCRNYLDVDGFAVLEAGARFIAQSPPVYAADYWGNKLAALDPAFCPHAENDHIIFRVSGDKCPICGIAFQVDPPTEEKQMSFFEEGK